MTKTLPITKAREELATLVEDANKKLTEYVITVNGSPAAVIMSIDEFESWKETMEIMADKELMKAIREGERELEQGKGVGWEEFKKELKINVSSHNLPKGRQTAQAA